MIPKAFIQELLSRVDIVDVIESAVPLKRAGSNLVACCPFHSEKSPSFTVSPSKQFYHCFGCGAHGSALGFLMEYHGLSFVEAVKDLASRVGMQVPEVVREPRTAAAQAAAGPATEDLAQALHEAALFYKAELKRAEHAIAYLKGRGLTGEIAARFGLGYAPAGWHGLAAVFADYQSSRLLVEAGLVIVSEEGRRYDRFRDRIMFPIVNQRGQIVGFGGRVLDKSEPKYLNSPETPLFEKGHELYGLFQARQGIREAHRVVVVEGYMDVVALAQYGVTCAVATLGTATTPWHVQKLLRQTDEIVFCFDGDAAGRRAAWRALENSLEQLQDGKQIKFLFLPDGEDPDSFVRKAGREAFETRLRDALPLSAFALKELSERVDMSSPEGRAKFLQDARPLVKGISAPILGLMLRKRIAELAGVSQVELEERFELKPARRTPSAPSLPARPASDPYAKLLVRVLAEPGLLAELREVSMPAPATQTPASSALFELLGQTDELGPEPNAGVLLEVLRMRGHEGTVQRLLPAVHDLQGFGRDALAVEVRQCVEDMHDRARKTQASRTLATVQSAAELSEAARSEVVEALGTRKGTAGH
jgi:DNA primase